MMKRVVGGLILSLILVTLGRAQENLDKGPNKLYIFIGIASPMAPTDFKNGWTTGANAGVAFSRNLPARLSFIGAAEFNNFDFDSHSYSESLSSTEDLVDVDGKTSFSLGGSAALKWRTSRAKSSGPVPYVLLGAGANYFSQGKITTAYNEKNVVSQGFSGVYPAVVLAVGSDLYIEEENLFVEPGVQILMTPTQRTKFWYIKVGMGVHLF